MQSVRMSAGYMAAAAACAVLLILTGVLMGQQGSGDKAGSAPVRENQGSMIFELTGKPEKIDAFLRMFEGYTILEQCRTGVTALERGGMHQHMQKPPQEVRATQFPLPGVVGSCPK